MSIESSFNSTLPGPWEAPCGFYKITSIQADLCCCIPSWNSTYSGRLSKQTFSRTLGDNLTVSGVKRLKDGWLFFLKKVEAKYTDTWLSKCLCVETPVWGESQCTAGTGDWGDLPRCPRLDTFPCFPFHQQTPRKQVFRFLMLLPLSECCHSRTVEQE